MTNVWFWHGEEFLYSWYKTNLFWVHHLCSSSELSVLRLLKSLDYGLPVGLLRAKLCLLLAVKVNSNQFLDIFPMVETFASIPCSNNPRALPESCGEWISQHSPHLFNDVLSYRSYQEGCATSRLCLILGNISSQCPFLSQIFSTIS